MLFFFLLFSSCSNNADQWTDLLNYKDFLDWENNVYPPPDKVQTEEEMVDSAKHFLAPKGYLSDDPKKSVFRYEIIDSKKMLVISGETMGFLTTKKSYQNYDLKMKFKYGKKWKWLGKRPRDGGIIYPMTSEKNREFNIHDGDIGSYWSFGCIADIPCVKSDQLPKSVKDITPIMKSFIPSLKDSMFLFDPSGKLDSFGLAIPEKQICVANPISDKPIGEWNELELISFGDTAIHIVNGNVVMVLLHCRYKKGNQYVPLREGQISFQSEGGEMFVEYIRLKHIDKIPDGILKNIKFKL